jgi:hypothetical protein
MNEAQIRTWIQQAIQRGGMYYYHAPDVAMTERRSRPDIFVIAPEGSAVIEVKRVQLKLFKIGDKKGTWDGIFRFDEIRDNQRHLLDSLWMAGDQPMFAIGPTGGRFSSRDILVMPWWKWMVFEQEHHANNSAYWSSIMEYFSRFNFKMEYDERGYYFPAGHAFWSVVPAIDIGYSRFEFISEPKSRRFETKKEEDAVSVES